MAPTDSGNAATAERGQVLSDGRERLDQIDQARRYGGTGHSEDDRSRVILGNDMAARPADHPQSLDAVVAHSGQDHGHGSGAEGAADRLEQKGPRGSKAADRG